VTDEKLRCSGCQVYKSPERFRRNASTRTGYENECKVCGNRRRKELARRKKREARRSPTITSSWQIAWDDMEPGVYEGTVVSKTIRRIDAALPHDPDRYPAAIARHGNDNPVIVLNHAVGNEFSGLSWRRLTIGCWGEPELLALYDECRVGSRLEITVTGEAPHGVITYQIT
jgi:hypothetical protein